MDRQILSEDNASFAYKGKAVDIKQVGRELGVRYVLEGTLQARRHIGARWLPKRTYSHRSHHDQIRCEPPQRQPSSSGVKPRFSKSLQGNLGDFRPKGGPISEAAQCTVSASRLRGRPSYP